MGKYFSRLLALIKKEFLAIWRDPKSRAIIIVPPFLQLIIFANALTMEVKDVDMMVLDYSSTQESREFIAKLENSKWFGKIYKVDDIKKIEENIEKQIIKAAIIIDSSFAKNIKKEEPVDIELILDGRSTSVATAMNGYLTQVASTYSKSLTHAKKVKHTQITIETRNWFNPNVIYQWYLLTVLIVILAMIVTLILTALSVARERELGTFEQLIVSPYSSFEILLGKTIPPLSLSLTILSIMTLVIIIFFGIPFVGSFLLFLFSSLIALLSFVGVGLFISSISKNQQQAILGVFAFMMPSILLSGFISPVDDMPQALQYVTYINPIKYFMIISRGMFLKGMHFEDVFSNLIPLVLIASITLTLASMTFKKNLE